MDQQNTLADKDKSAMAPINRGFLTAGLLALSRIGTDPSWIRDVLPGATLFGLGLGPVDQVDADPVLEHRAVLLERGQHPEDRGERGPKLVRRDPDELGPRVRDGGTRRCCRG